MLSADFINGHSPENMITLKDDQYISEPMQFLKINVTSDVQVDGDVNGRNLKDEYDNTVMVKNWRLLEKLIRLTKNNFFCRYMVIKLSMEKSLL